MPWENSPYRLADEVKKTVIHSKEQALVTLELIAFYSDYRPINAQRAKTKVIHAEMDAQPTVSQVRRACRSLAETCVVN